MLCEIHSNPLHPNHSAFYACKRSGPYGLSERWEDGPVFRDLAAQQAALASQREGVEAARKVRASPLKPRSNPVVGSGGLGPPLRATRCHHTCHCIHM